MSVDFLWLERWLTNSYRLVHARILLFRPMLARFCLPKTQGDAPHSPAKRRLSNRVLQDGANICVESTQRLLSLICESSRHDAIAGSLPWWYRVFYLYVTCQYLIAAMLRPDAFGALIQESWSTAISALCAHEHLSGFVKKCVSTLQIMWQKATDLQNLGNGPPMQPQGTTDGGFQDVFQQLGLEDGNPLFAIDYTSWLDGVDWNF